MNDPTEDPAMTRVHRLAQWGSMALEFCGHECRIVAGGDTECDPSRQPTVNPYAEERMGGLRITPSLDRKGCPRCGVGGCAC